MGYFFIWAVLVSFGLGFLPLWLTIVVFVGSVVGGNIWAHKLGEKKREELYEIAGVEVGNE